MPIFHGALEGLCRNGEMMVAVKPNMVDEIRQQQQPWEKWGTLTKIGTLFTTGARAAKVGWTQSYDLIQLNNRLHLSK